MTKKIVTQYMTVRILHACATGMIASIYATYLGSHGLNLFEVNLVNCFYFLTLFITEIPTGAFADVFGRKTSYVLSCFISATGFLLYAYASSFWQFVTAEVVVGIGVTFASGAFQAWLFDSLQHHGYDGDIKHVFAHAQIWPKVASMFAAYVGSQAAQYSMHLPFCMEGVVLCVEGTLVLFWLTEEYFQKQPFSFKLGLHSMREMVEHTITYGVKNTSIRFLLLVGILQTLCVQAPNMQWQPFFRNQSLHVGLLGYVSVAIACALMCGSYIAKHITVQPSQEKRMLVLCQVMTGLCLVGAVYAPFPYSLVLFILHEIPRGMYVPIKDKFLHDNIPSHARATVSSFESTAPHLGSIVGLLGSGYVADQYGIGHTWVCSGLVLILFTLCIGYRTKA